MKNPSQQWFRCLLLIGALCAAGTVQAGVPSFPLPPELDLPDVDLTGAHAQSGSEQLTLGGQLQDSQTSSDAATATTSSSTSSATVITSSASHADFPDANGMNGEAGAESHVTSTDPVAAIAGELATAVFLGDFLVGGAGGDLSLSVLVNGHLTMDDNGAAAFSDTFSIGVAASLVAFTNGGASSDLFAASAELGHIVGTAAGSSLVLDGDWDGTLIGSEIIVDSITDSNGNIVADSASDCANTTTTTSHCSYAFDTAAMVTLPSLLVGEQFSLFFGIGTTAYGFGTEFGLSAAFNNTAGLVLDPASGMTIQRLPAQVGQVTPTPAPTTLVLLAMGLLAAGAVGRFRRS